MWGVMGMDVRSMDGVTGIAGVGLLNHFLPPFSLHGKVWTLTVGDLTFILLPFTGKISTTFYHLFHNMVYL